MPKNLTDLFDRLLTLQQTRENQFKRDVLDAIDKLPVEHSTEAAALRKGLSPPYIVRPEDLDHAVRSLGKLMDRSAWFALVEASSAPGLVGNILDVAAQYLTRLDPTMTAEEVKLHPLVARIHGYSEGVGPKLAALEADGAVAKLANHLRLHYGHRLPNDVRGLLDALTLPSESPTVPLRMNPAALGNSEKNNEKQRTVAECERFIRGFLPPCEWTPTRLASEGRIGVPVTEVVEELRGRGCAEGDACQAIDAMLARGEIRCFNRDQRYVEWVGTTLPEAATPATGGDGKTATVPDDALLPPRALADAFGIPDKADALRTRLNRWRKTNHAGWVENADRSGTEPQFTYRVGAVRHIVEALKSGS